MHYLIIFNIILYIAYEKYIQLFTTMCQKQPNSRNDIVSFCIGNGFSRF